MQNEQTDGLRHISDLSLASFLLTSGFGLMGTVRTDKKRVEFIFSNVVRPDLPIDTIEHAMMVYYNRAALVDPLTFSETLRNLKAIVHQN